MTVRITFINGNYIDVDDKTKISAWKAAPNDKKLLYVNMLFEGSRYDGTEIATSYPEVGLLGLLATADWFAIQDDKMTKYKTSAVLSVKPLND